MPFPRFKPLVDLDTGDLNELIGEEENRYLDFKLDIYEENDPNDPEKKKKELCKDISALANASGGWIFCGVAEVNRVATLIAGIPDYSTADATIRRLNQAANSQIEPRIAGLNIRAISLDDGSNRYVLIIYVPRSPVAPHRSKLTWKFHLRRSVGVEDMDIQEIRAAFNSAARLGDSLSQFREKRLEVFDIARHPDIPVPLDVGYSLVLHTVPLTFVDVERRIEDALFRDIRARLAPIFQNKMQTARFNFSGVVIPLTQGTGRTTYFQIFRTGAVEYMERSLWPSVGITQNDQYVTLAAVADGAVEGLQETLLIMRSLEVEPPFVIMVSLLGIYDKYLNPDITASLERIHSISDRQQKMTRRSVLLPDVWCEDYDQPPEVLLKPIFDILWNTAGVDACVLYDVNGNWIPRNQR